MRLHIGAAALLAALSVSCVAYADDDDDDGGRSKGYARAEKHCAREAEERGLRVENIGDVDRVGKKQYEVRLRVDSRDFERRDRDRNGRWDRDLDRDEFRVTCQYDDREKRARIY